MSNENKDVNTVEDEVVESGVKILHKRGKGRPAPGELEPGEIGINTSTKEDDVNLHMYDDSYIRAQPRAWTADDDGVLHPIGGWDSLEKSGMYGDVPYSLTWDGEALGKTMSSWQHMLYDLNVFREGYQGWIDDTGEHPYEINFPIPDGGGVEDIDLTKYKRGFAALQVVPYHAEYEHDVVVTQPWLKVTASTAGGSYSNLRLEGDSIRINNNGFRNNIPITVPDRVSDESKPFIGVHDKPDHAYDTWVDTQTIINGPVADKYYQKWDDIDAGSEEDKKCNTPLAYRTGSTATLAVYGSSHVVAGAMRATHHEHPTEKYWEENGNVTRYTPEGMIYFNTTTKKFMGFDGTDWIDLSGGGTVASGDVNGGEFKTAQDAYDEMP